MLAAQLPEAGAAKMKSAALVPVMVMPLNVTGLVPVLLICTAVLADSRPSLCEPIFKAFVDAASR